MCQLFLSRKILDVDRAYKIGTSLHHGNAVITGKYNAAVHLDCIHLNSLFLLNVTPSLILPVLNRFMNLSVIKLPQNLILVWLAEVLRCCSESCVATSNWYFGIV